jgi:hypothetical protein
VVPRAVREEVAGILQANVDLLALQSGDPPVPVQERTSAVREWLVS